MRYRLTLLLGIIVSWAQAAGAACALERGPVKVAADAEAASIELLFFPTTIEALRAVPPPRPLPQDGRVAPVETTIHDVIGTMTAYRLAPDGSIHIVLADEAGRTIVAQIPDPACVAGSRFANDIRFARQQFSSRFRAEASFTEVRVPLEVRGIGFFDFLQGQRGLPPNGIALYPVIDLGFHPFPQPKAPPVVTKRRAVRPPAGCALPALTIGVSTNNACSGQGAVISWQAFDPAATVTIDGIGTSLPASGSRGVTVTASAAYSGRATNACGTGGEAVAVVALRADATAALTGPFTATQGTSVTLDVATTGATSWNLTSALGNHLQPSSGTVSGSVRYDATRSGSDRVTLIASGGPCGTLTRTLTINVTTPPTPPPPPPPQGLRCCDGTFSRSCFNCADKQGCCSGHGGVCGCPRTEDDEN